MNRSFVILGYCTTNWGKNPRVCLPSEEREEYLYVKSQKKLSPITLRMFNRYIDEYLVFAQARGLFQKRFDEQTLALFIRYTDRNTSLTPRTREAKTRIVQNWFQWVKKHY